MCFRLKIKSQKDAVFRTKNNYDKTEYKFIISKFKTLCCLYIIYNIIKVYALNWLMANYYSI